MKPVVWQSRRLSFYHKNRESDMSFLIQLELKPPTRSWGLVSKFSIRSFPKVTATNKENFITTKCFLERYKNWHAIPAVPSLWMLSPPGKTDMRGQPPWKSSPWSLNVGLEPQYPLNNILVCIRKQTGNKGVHGLFERGRHTGVPGGRWYREGKASDRSTLLKELLLGVGYSVKYWIRDRYLGPHRY